MSEPRSDTTATEIPDASEHRARPTPTGRARRAAATAVGAAGAETRRPSPRPAAPAEPVALTKPDGPLRPGRTKPDSAESVKAEPDNVKAGSKPDNAERDTSSDTRPTRTEVATGTPRRRLGARAPLWLGLLVAALAVLGAAAVLVAQLLPVKSGSTGERDQALAAAKSEVPVILSYDYKNFDADLAKGKTVLTGRIVSDYDKAMTTSIKPGAVKLKAVVQATSDSGGVESVSPDGKQVVVLVFGEQKVTNSSLSAPRTDLLRVRATMELVHGHWLVSKFDPI